jgi:uncharacterized OB-fold protein
VWTFSVVEKNATASVGIPTPYVVALIELEEGVRVFGNVVDCDVNEVRVGMAVTVAFAVASTGQHIPIFTSSTNSGGLQGI